MSVSGAFPEDDVLYDEEDESLPYPEEDEETEIIYEDAEQLSTLSFLNRLCL